MFCLPSSIVIVYLLLSRINNENDTEFVKTIAQFVGSMRKFGGVSFAIYVFTPIEHAKINTNTHVTYFICTVTYTRASRE